MGGLCEVGAEAELVAHCAGEDEEGGGLGEEVGEAGFELGGCCGLEVDFVAEGGGGEGPEHGRGGCGEGVGAEVKDGRGGVPFGGLEGCHSSCLGVECYGGGVVLVVVRILFGGCIRVSGVSVASACAKSSSCKHLLDQPSPP